MMDGGHYNNDSKVCESSPSVIGWARENRYQLKNTTGPCFKQPSDQFDIKFAALFSISVCQIHAGLNTQHTNFNNQSPLAPENSYSEKSWATRSKESLFCLSLRIQLWSQLICSISQDCSQWHTIKRDQWDLACLSIGMLWLFSPCQGRNHDSLSWIQSCNLSASHVRSRMVMSLVHPWGLVTKLQM